MDSNLPPTLCATKGCCSGSTCAEPQSCRSCYFRKVLLLHTCELLQMLLVSITGVSSYDNIILKDHDRCVFWKFALVSSAIQKFLQRNVNYRSPSHDRVMQCQMENVVVRKNHWVTQISGFHELKYSTLRPDTCFFWALRRRVSEILTPLLTNIPTLAYTAAPIHGTPHFALHRLVKEEIDAVQAARKVRKKPIHPISTNDTERMA